MNLEHYDELWQRHRPEHAGLVDFWNRRADSFNAHKNGDGESRELRRIFAMQLADETDVDADSRVLDIGCGAGHYSILLARRAAEVIGFDIAPKMIDHARENAAAEGCANVAFEVLDWETVDLAARGWEKRFKLVLACKTPAVNSLATLRKMIAACDGCCCYISKIDIANSVRDRLNSLLDWNEAESRSTGDFYCVFNLLWLMGYYPEISYLERSWESDMSLDDALMVYSRHFERLGASWEKRGTVAAEKLSSLAVDGRIHEKVTSKMVVMTWRV